MIIILMGAPGAGKGTQADLIAQRQGYKKISTGDALRKHIKLGTDIGNQAKTFMSEGKLVPDEVLLGILHTELNSAGKVPVLLDGYPRNLAQAKALQEIVGQDKIAGVIHLDVENATLIQRISGRRTCTNCGASYHVITNPSQAGDVCERCSSELTQRPDDAEDKVKVRLAIYVNETRPVLDFYRESGLYYRIDGNGNSDEVYSALASRLCSLI